MTKPTRIISKQSAVLLETKRQTTYYICDNNKSYSTSEIAEATGLSISCIRKRIKVFGLTSEVIFHQGPILMKGRRMGRPRKKIINKNTVKKFDRANCKRVSVLCINYKSCQEKRLGLPGAGIWIAPESTDACYSEQKKSLCGG